METNQHKPIEDKYKKIWVKDNIYKATDFSSKPKKYILVEFPYPSGAGLHMGHFMRFTLPDVYSRKLRMSGYNVLFPIGWDAYGLPAENYAVKTGVHPKITTEKAIQTYKSSFENAGFSFDWERVINTTSPQYYKWTQWIFLRFFEAGLAEIREEPVWWCEELKTVLANEEVLEDENGNKISERGDHPVTKKNLKQWILKITEYADKLLDGLEDIDFPLSVKLAQQNWIGKSNGSRIKFQTSDNQTLEIFTTRADTIFGVDFMVIAPEHSILKDNPKIENQTEIDQYIQKSINKSTREREAAKEKTGIKIKGLKAVNPFTNKEIPIFISDYVLIDYGTGAIMAVPAHDQRDYEFAKKFKTSITQTIFSNDNNLFSSEIETEALTIKEGVHKITTDSQKLFSNTKESVSTTELSKAVNEFISKNDLGKIETTYRLRDWLFSRQRYWGEPIPIIHKPNGEIEAIVHTQDPNVSDSLPLLLPEIDDYTPPSDGSSPLVRDKDWFNLKDGSTRETNTMPNWAGSCWYYLRYLDPKNSEEFCSKEKIDYWMPVDIYFGGSEHTTLHLLYSRFWHNFLYDEKLVNTPEPYQKRIMGGLLLGSDGLKQSKSTNNGADLNEMLNIYGADALRMHICFMGPYEGTIKWNENGVKACRKFLDTMYKLEDKIDKDFTDTKETITALHKSIKNSSQMLDSLKMNVAVAELMKFQNVLKAVDKISVDTWKTFIQLISPFAVFTAEELWQKANKFSNYESKNSVHLTTWPEFNPELIIDQLVTIGVQVNGKIRDEISLKPDEDESKAKELVLELEKVQKYTKDMQVVKFIYKPSKIINLIVK